MQSHSAKQETLEAVSRLPDNADMEGACIICILENTRKGQRKAEQSKTQSTKKP